MVDYTPGMRIIVRHEEWMIRKIEKNSLDNQTLYCVGVSSLVKDREAAFLADLDDIEILDPSNVKLVVDESPHFGKSLLYLESQWRKKIPTDKYLHIGHNAVMDTMDYQLDPAVMALQNSRQRILIADSVGLGKTLEAGILMSELIARGKGKRILVITVKSMMTQFQKEMWNRFTIPLVRLDSKKIQKIRSELPSNYNPFYYYDKTIVSMDTLKRDVQYATYLEKAYWDIIVIDEAQNVAERGSREAQRARLAKLLADRSDSLILLSATPHDGRARSFASLMNMLDSTAIADPDNYEAKDIQGLFIRRFKKDINAGSKFLERKVSVEQCKASDVEEKAFDVFSEMDLKMDSDRNNSGGYLFKTGLEKSLFSSPAACIKSIDERIKKLKGKNTQESIHDTEELEKLRDDLVKITPGKFMRYQKLLELLRSPDYGWNPKNTDDRIVIFTERIETMKYLVENLSKDLHMDNEQIKSISGSDSDIVQQEIVEDFGRTESSVRVLVASDVASEGLNLHYLCHRLIHFDTPWSLMVFQQRNGRIDRYGQKKNPDIRHMLIESENRKIHGDIRILKILIDKEEQALKNIGDPALLMGKYSIEGEELVVTDAIENGVNPDDFEKSLDKEKPFDPLDILLGTATADAEEKVHDKVKKIDDKTLFTDKEYIVRGVPYINRDIPNPVEDLHENSVLDIRITDEMARRLRAMIPEETYPESGHLRVSDNKRFCQDRMSLSMQNNMNENSWPDVQYLWKQHPIVTWLNDKASLLFKRDEVPVLDISDGVSKGEIIFIVSGSMPNERSTPLVDEWFAFRYIDGECTDIMTMEEVASYAKLGNKNIVNSSSTDMDIGSAEALIDDVIDKSRRYLKDFYDRYQKESDAMIDKELDKLSELKKKQTDFYTCQLSMSENQRNRKCDEVDKLFDEYTKWVKETLTIKNNPYIKINAVIMGV